MYFLRISRRGLFYWLALRALLTLVMVVGRSDPAAGLILDGRVLLAALLLSSFLGRIDLKRRGESILAANLGLSTITYEVAWLLPAISTEGILRLVLALI